MNPLAGITLIIFFVGSNLFWANKADDLSERVKQTRIESSVYLEEAKKQNQQIYQLNTELAEVNHQVRLLRAITKKQATELAEEKRKNRIQPRASRSRKPIQKIPGGDIFAKARAWANTPFAKRVANCESGGSPTAISGTGKYRGKWQMDSSFWKTYGGLSFASVPNLASESQQDVVAYRGWLARGWQPWSCA